MRSRTWGIAIWLGVAIAFFGGRALAADTSNGSKNFSVPSTVPNYFSNESGPMIGGAAETRRGPLYSGQSFAAPSPRETAAAPVRQHIAMAEPRGRLIRGHHEAPTVAHHVALHGRAPAHGTSHATHVAKRTTSHATTHTASKTRVTSTHRHASG